MSLIGDRLWGSDLFTRRINRAPSVILSNIVPWLTIGGASLLTFSPIIASAPLLPPISFMMLVAWMFLRPGLLPVWAGAPLGLVDDLFSGQPFGSAMLLWSIAMIAGEIVDGWLKWRGFWQDWFIASVFVAVYLFLAMALATFAGGIWHPAVLGPQLLLSIIAYPIVTRVIAILDLLRRARVKVLG